MNRQAAGATAPCALRTDGDGWVVTGELGFATAPALLRYGAMQWRATSPRWIDLRQVERVDSAGLAILIGWMRCGRQAGRQLAVRGELPQQLASLASFYGVRELFADGENHGCATGR